MEKLSGILNFLRGGSWCGDSETPAPKPNGFSASDDDERFEEDSIADHVDGRLATILNLCAYADGDFRQRLEILKESARAFEGESLVDEQYMALQRRIAELEELLDKKTDELTRLLTNHLVGLSEITGETYDYDDDDCDCEGCREGEEDPETTEEDFRDLHGLTDDDEVEDVLDEDDDPYDPYA